MLPYLHQDGLSGVEGVGRLAYLRYPILRQDGLSDAEVVVHHHLSALPYFAPGRSVWRGEALFVRPVCVTLFCLAVLPAGSYL